MIIIGEKINGAISSVAEAINERNSGYIENLVQKQVDAGADYLDICAGTAPDKEYGALVWLIDVVQNATDTPLCIDSPDPNILKSIFGRIKKPGIINSISGEGEKCRLLFPLLKANPEWQVIVLCCDNKGIPASADDKVSVATELIERGGEFGITPDRIHIDPLVLALTAVNDSALNFTEAVRRIKEKYEGIKVTAAMSNISFGMPVRKLINKNFLVLAMAAGLDSAILNPMDREIVETIYATEALLGRDRLCRKYNIAFRSGKIGTNGKKPG